MKASIKVLILVALGISCLTLNTGAQQPAVAPPAVVPLPTVSAGFNDSTFLFQEYPAQWGHKLATTGTNVTGLSFVADGETMKLTKQLAEAKSDGDKDKIKEKLKELLVKQFDDRQKRHEKELEALETQVKKLKEMVGKRQENKKDIIDERIKQLQRDAQGLGW